MTRDRMLALLTTLLDCGRHNECPRCGARRPLMSAATPCADDCELAKAIKWFRLGPKGAELAWFMPGVGHIGAEDA